MDFFADGFELLLAKGYLRLSSFTLSLDEIIA